MRKITLFTVPHTGTHFVYSFFEAIGVNREEHQLKPTAVNAEYFPMHSPQTPIADLPLYNHGFRNNRRLIVTARDPYLGAFRYRSISPSHTIENYAKCWDTFLSVVKSRKPFYIDIGIREEEREEHLFAAIDYLNLKNYDTDAVKNFAKSWKPQNASNNAEKLAYLNDGMLPDADWSPLNEAAAWYKSLPTNNA